MSDMVNMINPVGRTVSLRGTGGAFLMTGTDKVRSGYGNGDCIMIDFEHSVFALSDSTERYSSASRNLLERLNEMLRTCGVPETADEWKEAADRLFSSQEYRQKATFSCASFSGRSGCIEITVLNGGDSAIFLLNTATGIFEYMSRPDMYFAGRSREISHVSKLVLDSGSYRLMLCTDGLSDVAKTAGVNPADILMDSIKYDAAEIPENIRKMIEAADAEGAEYDDTGVLILDPAACLKKNEGVILMGGTTPVEEGGYQRIKNSAGETERWIGIDDISGNEEMLRICGIKVLS